MNCMKVIQVHNYYQQAGGEDAVVKAEHDLLIEKGDEVVPYYKDNQALGTGVWELAKASLTTIWNWQTYREFRELLRSEKPDVVHCHNTFPLISPSIYWACAKEGIPVVQTLHNYRLLCLNAFLFRETKLGDKSISRGEICEKCLTKNFKYPGINYGCYRNSRAGSLIVALMLLFHKLIGTWSRKVTAYIALTDFQKQKMIEGGLPGDKIWVKPNFLQRTEDWGQKTDEGNQQSIINGQQSDFRGLSSDVRSLIAGQTPFALFVGRLSPEKGCDVLLKAWARFQQTWRREHGGVVSDTFQLLIVGDGPEREKLEKLSVKLKMTSSVKFVGKQPKCKIMGLMREGCFLVLPSLWYEGFPMTIVEAFSCGLPVIAANHGGMKSVIKEGRTGLLFNSGDPLNLSETLDKAFNNTKLRELGKCALDEYEMYYSEDANRDLLLGLYNKIGK